jgi:hypothetical protein
MTDKEMLSAIVAQFTGKKPPMHALSPPILTESVA